MFSDAVEGPIDQYAEVMWIFIKACMVYLFHHFASNMKSKLIIILSVVVHLLLMVPIVTTNFWYDENFTLMVVRLPFSRMMTALQGDVHPPLYYLLLWPLGQIHGLPIWMLRIPSLIFSFISLWAFWQILKWLISDWRIRLVSWVIFAISGSQLYYASEARMYSLLTMLILLAILAILNRKWIWVGILTAAILWTHNYGIYYSVCLFFTAVLVEWNSILLLFQRKGYKLYRPFWILSFLLAWISFIPWIMILLSQMKTIQGNYWLTALRLGDVLDAVYESFILIDQLLSAEIWSKFVFWGWVSFVILWFITIYRSPAFRANLKAIIRFRKYFPIVILFAIGPFVMALVSSLLWQPILLYRALIPCAPFLGILLVMPFASMPGFLTNKYRLAFLTALVLISPMWIMNTIRLYAPVNNNRGENDLLVMNELQYIQSHWRDGDIVVHVGDGSWITMVPYAVHPSDHYKLDPCYPARGSISPLSRAGLGEITLFPDQLTGPFWLLTEETPMTPACELPIVSKLVKDRLPIYCYRDDLLMKSCLYLVNR
jgi:uncharacterized membrane protein